MSDAYKAFSYIRLVGYVSRYALGLMAQELDRFKHIGFDSECCGCVLRKTYGLPCACELAHYDHRMIPLPHIHIMWSILTFSYISSSQAHGQLRIQR